MEKVMVVTGAGRGIGAACARLGAAQGYKVCVNYARNRAAADAVVAQIAGAGGHAIAVQADVADPAQVHRLFETVDARLGRLTALVNNAGISGALKPVEDLERPDLDEVFGLNVYGLFSCCAQAVKRMSTRHGGRGGAIVNVGSIAARTGGLRGMVAYAASKAAVDTFTLGLAKEVGREGIRVNCLRPGTTRTDIVAPLGADVLAQIAVATPLGRLGDTEEIAEGILFLLSDKASYVHGAIYDVSGGR